ncbi:MAG: hypothetical protein ACP5R5_01605 [Armatimonadota bacterium]
MSGRRVCVSAVVLAILSASACAGASYFYSFESGNLEGWAADATDQGICPWHIVPSTKLRYHGLWSLEYYMNNFNDATKIWIERSYEVPAGRRYDVSLSWKLATKDAYVGACPIIAYIGDRDPETRDDAFQIVGSTLGDGSGNYVWISPSYVRTGVLPSGSGSTQGKIWVAIGIWGTFEVTYYWYVDAVTVEITESASAVSVGQARQAPDGTRVFLQAKVASSGWNDLNSSDPLLRRIYVEEPNRSAGVMVKHYRTFSGDPVRGDVLDISGVMATVDGERVIDCATIAKSPDSPSALPVESLYIRNVSVGGGPFGPYVPGVAGSFGLNNSGLLISTFGKVVSTGTGYFVIDDGSRQFACGKSVVSGLAVSTADAYAGIPMPAVGSYVSVTGLCGVFSSGGHYYPILRPRAPGDVVQVIP